MSRGLIIGLLVAVAGIGGYFWSQQAADEAPVGTLEEAAPESGAETLGDAVDDAMQGASDAVDDAAQGASDAVNDAATAAQDAMDDAAQTVEEAADAAQGAVDDAARAIEETATDAAQSMEAEENSEVFTVENFDPVKVQQLIDGSELGAETKKTLSTMLQEAEQAPETLGAVLSSIKSALGA